MTAPDIRPATSSQRGSALVISLVLLLLVTLAALGSMSSAIVQEHMAHNISRMHERFQAAETGLRYVEQQIRANAMALPDMPCTESCDVPAALSASVASTPGPEWSRVPAAIVGTESQVWYRLVQLGDSSLSVNLSAGPVSTLYRVSIISQRDANHTLLEGVYAFTRI